MEVRLFSPGIDFIVGHVVCKEDFALLISIENSGVVFHQYELEVIGTKLRIVPVILILGHGDVRAGNPFSHLVGTVANVGFNLCGPCLAIGFDNVLTNRHVGRECGQLKEVRNGVLKGYYQSFVIGSGDVQLTFIVAFDDIEHVFIVCSGLRCNGTIPRINEVIGSEGFSVTPFQTITQVEGIDPTIAGNLIFFCLTWNRNTILVYGH